MPAEPSDPVVVTINDNQATDSSPHAMTQPTAPLNPALLSMTSTETLHASVLASRFLAVLDSTIVAVALPKIVSDLGNPHYLSWVVAAYLLTNSAILPISGRLSDIIGRRAVYLGSLIVFLISSALCGAANSTWFLIGARAVQGLGGGALNAMTMVVVGDISSPAERPANMSLVGSIAGLAALFGPIIGGVLTAFLSWRAIFYVNLPFGAISFYLGWVSMKRFETIPKRLPLDWIGSILIAAAATCLVLFITWGGDEDIGYPWGSGTIIGLIVACAVLLLLFIVQEVRHPLPILQMGLMKIPNFRVNIALISFSYWGMLSAVNYLAVYWQTVNGDPAWLSGCKITGFVVGFLAGTAIAKRWIAKTKKLPLMLAFAGALLSVGMGLLSTITESTNYGFFFLYMLLLGLGIGFQIPATSTLVQMSVAQKDIAVAMANFSFNSLIGACIGITVAGTAFNRELHNRLHAGASIRNATAHAAAECFRASMYPCIISFVLGFFVQPIKQKKLITTQVTSSAPASAVASPAVDKVAPPTPQVVMEMSPISENSSPPQTDLPPVAE